MKRSGLPARTTRIKNKGRSRFPKLRDDKYVEFIGRLPCALWTNRPTVHVCDGPIEVAHVKTRGAGGADRGNTIPLCRWAHRMQHSVGIKTFQKSYGLDFKELAAEYLREFERYGESL